MSGIEFNHINVDNSLRKPEIKEISKLSKDREKLKVLLNTNSEINEFISQDYKAANEGYLAKNGKSVRDLQIGLGFTGKDVDGIFGKKTFFALIKFQEKNGLYVDGLAGDKTQTKLFSNEKSIPKKQENLHSEEMYARYGKNFVNFIEKRGFPRGRRGQCGANIGNILLSYGVSGLPRSGRDGYRWESFLENNPNFIKVDISNPTDVKPGGILVYGKNYGNRLRSKYGHVEVALGGGKYYFGRVNNHPGGSINASNNESGFTGFAYYPKNPSMMIS